VSVEGFVVGVGFVKVVETGDGMGWEWKTQARVKDVRIYRRRKDSFLFPETINRNNAIVSFTKVLL